MILTKTYNFTFANGKCFSCGKKIRKKNHTWCSAECLNDSINTHQIEPVLTEKKKRTKSNLSARNKDGSFKGEAYCK